MSIIIVIMFFLISIITTLYIRYIYTRFHLNVAESEAQHLSEYAKIRITSYSAYGWLIDHWMETNDIAEPPKSRDMKNSWINLLDLPLVTEEEVKAMTKEEQVAFSYICYTRIAYGFDLIYSAFNTEEFRCVSIRDDLAYVIFEADDNIENNDHLQPKVIELDADDRKMLKKVMESKSEEGIMDKYYSPDDGMTYLVYYIPIFYEDEIKAVLVWERNYSDIENEITRDSIGISLANIILLLTIFLVVMAVYYRYHNEKLRNTSRQEREKTEIDICTKIQLSQLPDIQKELSGREGFDLNAYIEPAKGVGGDFYDCFMIDEHRIGLVIADVSDKGIPAAMFMMAARSLIKSEMKQNEEPAAVMKKVNEQLSDRNEAGMFVTVWLAVIDLITGKCTVVNAGHENPLVRNGDGKWEILRYPHMMPAAITPDAVFVQHEHRLEPGDMIFVYTDGVTDSVNQRKERFGEEGIIRTMEKNDSSDPDSIIESMHRAIKDFSGGEEQFDDICMICFKYNGTDSITVNADNEDLHVVTNFVTEKAKRAGIEPKRTSSLRLAAEEIFGNIIDYAYPDGKGKVIITVRTDRELNTLSMTFKDFGKPFDPTQKAVPDIPGTTKDMKVGGLGIYFTKELTDSISYTYDNANILTLSVNIIKG